jgi:hypothetical protein
VGAIHFVRRKYLNEIAWTHLADFERAFEETPHTLIDRTGGRQPSVSTQSGRDADRVSRRPVGHKSLQQDRDRLSTIPREASQLMSYSHRVPEVI